MENLRVTNFNNGDPINDAIFNYNGGNLSNSVNQSGQYSNYFTHSYYNYNDNIFFYNGFAMQDIRNVCPEGWHIPSIEEWIQLLDIFGDGYIDEGWFITNIPAIWNCGSALKSTNSWTNVLYPPTNYSYMSILPGSSDWLGGSYSSLITKIWTNSLTGYSTSYSDGLFILQLSDENSDARFEQQGLNEFGCIRCIKDD